MSKKVYVKPYPKEFREQVVKLVQLEDRSALELARDSRFRWIRYSARYSRRSATRAAVRTA